jgi:hypothetical protein
MTLMRVAAHDGMVLTYDTDDTETVHIEAPNDVHEVGHTESGAVLRELGQAHLRLRVDFKPGKRPLWVDQATAALPDLRAGGELLRAALQAEGIPAETASRIWNRFFYGQPWGLDMPPMSPEQVDEFRDLENAIVLKRAGGGRVERDGDRIVIHCGEPEEEPTFPAGQTAGEQFAAVMDSIMLDSARAHFGDKMADRMKERMGMEGRDDG